MNYEGVFCFRKQVYVVGLKGFVIYERSKAVWAPFPDFQ